MKFYLWIVLSSAFLSCTPTKSTSDSQSVPDSTVSVSVRPNMNIDASIPTKFVDKISAEMLDKNISVYQGKIYRSGNEPFTRFALYISDTESYPVIGNKEFYAFIETQQDASVVLAGEKTERLNQPWIRVFYVQKTK